MIKGSHGKAIMSDRNIWKKFSRKDDYLEIDLTHQKRLTLSQKKIERSCAHKEYLLVKSIRCTFFDQWRTVSSYRHAMWMMYYDITRRRGTADVNFKCDFVHESKIHYLLSCILFFRKRSFLKKRCISLEWNKKYYSLHDDLFENEEVGSIRFWWKKIEMILKRIWNSVIESIIMKIYFIE